MNEELMRKLSEFTEEEKKMFAGRGGKGKVKSSEGKFPAADKKEMLINGELMQIRRHPRFIHFPRQKRNYIEGFYMYRGKTTHLVEHQQILLQEGELLFVSPDAEQEIFPAGEGDIAVHFILLPEFFDDSFTLLGDGENLLRDFFVKFLRNGNEGNQYLYFQVAEIRPIQNLLENMLWLMAEKRRDRCIALQATMGLLMMQLLDYTEKLNLGEETFDLNLMIRVLRYIEENYRDGKLNDLCHLLGCDIYWLSRAIKKLAGKNYKELLQIKRLNQAAFMLLNTRAAISDISLAVGYDNTSYFHRLFRDYYGVSPKEYRREKKIRL